MQKKQFDSNSSRIQAAFHLALVYDQNEQREEAIEMYKLALDLMEPIGSQNYDSNDFWYQGHAYLAFGNLEKAKQSFESGIEMDKAGTDGDENSDTYYDLMILLYDMGLTSEAREKAEFLIETIEKGEIKEFRHSHEKILKEATRIIERSSDRV